MPGSNHPGEDTELFRRLSGAAIVQIGTPSECPLEGGGLAIDYSLPGESEILRAVLLSSVWSRLGARPTNLIWVRGLQREQLRHQTDRRENENRRPPI